MTTTMNYVIFSSLLLLTAACAPRHREFAVPVDQTPGMVEAAYDACVAENPYRYQYWAVIEWEAAQHECMRDKGYRIARRR